MGQEIICRERKVFETHSKEKEKELEMQTKGMM